ncbi:MAG TPA: hypothetical protein VK689_13370 [Armatimonadota bacterium]|nr:hypothetical protein [Armatimonadota bacterium]
MGRELTELSYEGWVNWVFDHPVTEPPWHFEGDADWWDEERDPAATAGYLARLFEEPERLLEQFTPAQINVGLWFLASVSCSNHMFALLDEAVPWAARKRAIEAMAVLYEKLFAPVCTEFYGHLGAGPEKPNPVNSICYMWWDLCPVTPYAPSPSDPERDAVVLDVLQRILRLPSPACREAALRGLGRSQARYPTRTQQIIDELLAREPALPAELQAYALAARVGAVG